MTFIMYHERVHHRTTTRQNVHAEATTTDTAEYPHTEEVTLPWSAVQLHPCPLAFFHMPLLNSNCHWSWHSACSTWTTLCLATTKYDQKKTDRVNFIQTAKLLNCRIIILHCKNKNLHTAQLLRRWRRWCHCERFFCLSASIARQPCLARAAPWSETMRKPCFTHY